MLKSVYTYFAPTDICFVFVHDIQRRSLFDRVNILQYSQIWYFAI